MKTIAVIPARGGSKRIPRKNIIPFVGKPLIAHTIEQAKQSKKISRVIVSTDEAQIAKVSRGYGAEVINRPRELSTNTASSESALLHVLEVLKVKEDFSPDVVVFLQCTSPLRESDDIDKAIETFKKENADSLFSGFRFNKYIWRTVDNKPISINFDYKKKRWREQDFPLQIQENGSIYVIKSATLKRNKSRFGGKIAVYEMSYLNSFQIDTQEDLLLCESILKIKSEKSIRGS